MENSKKVLLSTIGVAILIVLLTGVTFAFFNYTRTGPTNTIKVGRISFTTNQYQTISLTDLFPIDPEEQGIMEDSTKVGTLSVTITGDTDYVDGIEYLVSSVNSNIYTSQGQTIPISLDFTVSGLGDENSNYWTARDSKNANIYKKLVGDTLVGDQMLLVGYIKKNTTNGTAEGVNGSITIKAYIDENKIAITDTPDENSEWQQGRTVISTTEWNAIKTTGISFKVKVEANEGIWVIGAVEDIMKRNAVMDNINSTYVNNLTPGIDYTHVSGDTNGKGVYILSSTQNDDYPVMYYRGDVKDNNVFFANYCWKAVRTTDTGGVKLIYNGKKTHKKVDLTREDYGELVSNTGNYTFDSSDNSWNNSIRGDVDEEDAYEFSFSLSPGVYYYEFTGTFFPIDDDSWVELDVYLNDDYYDGPVNDYYDEIISFKNSFEITNSSDVVKVSLYGKGNNNENPTTIKMNIKKEDASLEMGCDNESTQANVDMVNNEVITNNISYNSEGNSIAYNGYMYGTIYPINSSGWTSGAKFGNSFTWDGMNYKLEGTTTTTPNSTHHYSCNLTDANATCTEIRYVIYVLQNQKYYVTLQNGKSIEDAVVEMNLNTTDSTIKNKIDMWYEENLLNYSNKFEDTIWCNDRSGGLLSNDLDPTKSVIFGSYGRSYGYDDGRVTGPPIVSCPNKNDAFTVNDKVNGNGKLTYPIALLTSDEIALAGSLNDFNSQFYLNNGDYYWTMSPSGTRLSRSGSQYIIVPSLFAVTNSELWSLDAKQKYSNLRPSISLKPGQLIRSGTGTAFDPYVIE